MKGNRVHLSLPFVGSPTGSHDKMAFRENCLRKGRVKCITDKGTTALKKTATFMVLAARVLNRGYFLKDE